MLGFLFMCLEGEFSAVEVFPKNTDLESGMVNLGVNFVGPWCLDMWSNVILYVSGKFLFWFSFDCFWFFFL